MVEYHYNDPYSNPDATTRMDYYSVPWFPSTYYDSHHIGIEDWDVYAAHLAAYEQRRDSLSCFGVNIQGELNELTVSGTLYAEKVAEYTGENLVMHLALTETDIPENWHGETTVNFVSRKLFPDGNGTPLDFSSASLQSFDFTLDLDPSWVQNNCELVYFIQDNDTKEILQGNKIKLNDLSIDVGISDASITEVAIYPNPVQDVLILQADDTQSLSNIRIINLIGKTLIQQDSYNNGIDMKLLPKGIYLLSYSIAGATQTKKIIKE